MKQLLFAALLLSAVSLALADTELKGNPESLRSFLHPSDKLVTLSAEAEKKAYTDTAIINLVVTTKKTRLADAIQANSSLREDISNTLIQQGIKAENINSAKFSTSPQYGWFGKKPDSYEVVNRVAITISEQAHLKAVAELADESPEITLSTTVFEHSLKEQFKQEVKQAALDKVLLQKQFYEQNLSVKLTPVSFSDSQVYQQPTRSAQLMEEEVVVTGFRKSRDSYSSADKRSIPTRSPSFDEVEYKASIAVDFKVVPAENR